MVAKELLSCDPMIIDEERIKIGAPPGPRNTLVWFLPSIVEELLSFCDALRELVWPSDSYISVVDLNIFAESIEKEGELEQGGGIWKQFREDAKFFEVSISKGFLFSIRTIVRRLKI